MFCFRNLEECINQVTKIDDNIEIDLTKHVQSGNFYISKCRKLSQNKLTVIMNPNQNDIHRTTHKNSEISILINTGLAHNDSNL